MKIISLNKGLGADPENQFSFFQVIITPDFNGYTTGFIKYKNDIMKYYRRMKAALIVALIALICLWLYGCESFTGS